jgi:hypothetical protein
MAGWRRWFEEMRARKAAGELQRFPGGRKSGAQWVTPRMREQREQETMERRRAEPAARRAQERSPACASMPPRRRGRPSNAELVMRAKRQVAESLAQVQARLDEAQAQERLTELLAALNAGQN